MKDIRSWGLEKRRDSYVLKDIFLSISFHSINPKLFCVDIPNKLVSQVVNEVVYLIPVMLHTARPEKKRLT